MARPKGLPKTGGRKAGTPNKATVARQEATSAAIERIEQAAPGALEDLTALGLLQAIYRDRNMPPDLRVDCAKAAVRFEVPALSSSSVNANVTSDLGERLKNARLRARAHARVAERCGGKIHPDQLSAARKAAYRVGDAGSDDEIDAAVDRALEELSAASPVSGLTDEEDQAA